ncbi:DNA-binding transcriptional regulator CytR [Vibrio sp. qd031]|uniref:DNA-binding transcriptional regulator CytR n=1 Tax=Vibrio sp. qd031 TaxID=1603038 RepID=UPI000A11BE42|nr:DNA-binding transcriptional regulator CytR [Vibrio sp. qd031]
MATMKDVADLAGVSTATVSRALMNPEKVSVSTRKRVEEAIVEAGYAPNSLARNLRRNESKTIVVIVPDICDTYFSEIIRGIEDAALEQGYLVLLGDASKHKGRENAFVNLVFTKQADGMILLGSDVPFDVSKEEQRNLPPLVMSCEYAPELELPTVHIDNLTAAYDIVNHLTSIGHRRVAQISGPITSPLSNFRHRGYQQALRRSGGALNDGFTAYGDFSFDSGAQLAKELLSSSLAPTAIFCHNDAMAIGAMQTVKKMGLRIPEDISVVGFDDIQYSAYTDPPLTTVKQPRYEIGRESALMLLARLKGHSGSIPSKILEAKSVIRESTCPPASALEGNNEHPAEVNPATF